MTAAELKEFESLENLQALFRDPEGQERLTHLGVRTALVATWDGLLVDSVVCDDDPVELDSLAAKAAAALQLSHVKGPSRGSVDGVVAEFEEGSTVIVDPIGTNALVAFVTKPSPDVAQMRTELRTLAQQGLAGAESSVASPSPDAADLPPAEVLPSPAKPAVVRTPSRRPGPSTPAVPPISTTPPTPRRPAPTAPVPPPAAPRLELKPKSGTDGRPAVSTVQEIMRSTPAGRRVILKNVALAAAGSSATLTVELVLDGRKVVGKTVTRNDATQFLAAAAEAAVNAVTQLLPDGYGVVLEQITLVTSAVDEGSIRGVSVKVRFITPAGEQTLLGIAKIAGDESSAGAKTVLSAVNSSLEAILGQRADRVH